jgi:hypothetical protein
LIRSALARLDADKRLVFTLKELQHLSYKEISDITGSAIPKLKTDLHRAKIEMRRALSPYLEAKDELRKISDLIDDLVEGELDEQPPDKLIRTFRLFAMQRAIRDVETRKGNLRSLFI